ncbi:MAG TPA: hypothetical protein VJT31_38930 [Rugosimonospora sp.]|nr:hypothetical protein [Rugosimonospora sp.]
MERDQSSRWLTIGVRILYGGLAIFAGFVIAGGAGAPTGVLLGIFGLATLVGLAALAVIYAGIVKGRAEERRFRAEFARQEAQRVARQQAQSLGAALLDLAVATARQLATPERTAHRPAAPTPPAEQPAADPRAARRILLRLRLWYLLIMPLGLVSGVPISILAPGLRPLWPYAAAWAASGPIAGLLALYAARRRRVTVLRLRYTCVLISYLSGGFTGLLFCAEIAAAIRDAFTPGAVAMSWHLLFGVLPTVLLCVVLRVAVARTRQRDRAAGVAIEPFGLD